MVELRGFEPLTFSLRTRRATNCATAPCAGEISTRVAGPPNRPGLLRGCPGWRRTTSIGRQPLSPPPLSAAAWRDLARVAGDRADPCHGGARGRRHLRRVTGLSLPATQVPVARFASASSRAAREASSAERARAESSSLRPLDQTPVESRSIVETLRRAAAGLAT